jgi:hypothetical protein
MAWTGCLAPASEQCRAVTNMYISIKVYIFRECVSNKTYCRTLFQELEVNSASGAPTLPMSSNLQVRFWGVQWHNGDLGNLFFTFLGSDRYRYALQRIVPKVQWVHRCNTPRNPSRETVLP